MAQYFVDPAGGQTELDRFSVKRQGAFYATAVIGTDGGRDVFEFPQTSNNESFIGFDEAGQIADSEVLILIKTDATGLQNNGGIAQRAGSVTGYGGSILGTNRYRLSSIVNETPSIIADPNPAGIVTTTYSYIRQRITGNQIKIRAWDETSSEPTSWLVETTDTTIPAAGFSGIYGNTTEPFYVAAWSLGTNGDPAPVKALTPEQFYTDFQGTTVGTLPAGFSSVIEDLGVAEIREDLSLPSSRELLIGDGGAYDVGSVTWDIPGLAYNTEVAVKMRLSSTSFRTGAYVKVRRLSVAELTVGWRGGSVEFGASNLSDVYTEFSDLSVTTSRTSWFWFRLRAEGDQVKYRIWADGDTEPLPWTDTATYSELAFDGKAQIISGDMRTDIHVAEWGVGINGADAPTAPLPTGPNTPVNPSITNLLSTSARLTWEQG